MSKVVKKSVVIFVLALFLWFTALSTIMYLASPTQKEQQAEIDCISNGFERDSEKKVCLDNISWDFLNDKNIGVEEINIKTEKDCISNSGTRYAENEVCVIK